MHGCRCPAQGCGTSLPSGREGGPVALAHAAVCHGCQRAQRAAARQAAVRLRRAGAAVRAHADARRRRGGVHAAAAGPGDAQAAHAMHPGRCRRSGHACRRAARQCAAARVPGSRGRGAAASLPAAQQRSGPSAAPGRILLTCLLPSSGVLDYLPSRLAQRPCLAACMCLYACWAACWRSMAIGSSCRHCS